MVLVDSSIWIEAGRKAGDIAVKVGLEGLLEEYEAALCSVVRLEVLGGARPEDRRRWEAAFGVLPFQSVDERTWIMAVRHGWRLRDAGVAVPWNDLLLASLSIELGWRIYARDRHFNQMQGIIGVRLYEPGCGGQYAPD
jgi:predicted nucleic acid-binding protein